MGIRTEEQGGAIVVYPEGDIDLDQSPSVRKHLLAQLSDKNLVVCLEKVEYMDSSGVACLVEGLQAAKQKNLSFSLAAVNAKVLRVLEVARLDKVFTIFDSVEEAVIA